MWFYKPIVGLIVSFLVQAVAQADAPRADLRALLLKYRCPIYDRLVRIHDAGDPASDRHRFIAIGVPDGHYVQCIFHDRTRKLYCEAASGFYEAPPGARRTAYLPPAAIAGLGRLGFSTDDSHGNFSLDRDVGDNPDYMALADLMLGALYAGYDARADMKLKIDAPFAPLPNSTCDPTS